MRKQNLKILVADLERAIAELKSEIYSDRGAYVLHSDGTRSYPEIDDDDGECD